MSLFASNNRYFNWGGTTVLNRSAVPNLVKLHWGNHYVWETKPDVSLQVFQYRQGSYQGIRQ
jgi:hypothetical protein